MTVNTTIPLGKKTELDKYLKNNPRLGVVVIDDVDGAKVIQLLKTPMLDKLNKELKKINIMLSADLPADSTTYNIQGEGKDKMNPIIIVNIRTILFSAGDISGISGTISISVIKK